MDLSRALTWLTILFYVFPSSSLLNDEKRWRFGVAAAKQRETSGPNNESLRLYSELTHPVNSFQSEPTKGLSWIPGESMNLTLYQQRISIIITEKNHSLFPRYEPMLFKCSICSSCLEHKEQNTLAYPDNCNGEWRGSYQHWPENYFLFFNVITHLCIKYTLCLTIPTQF